MIDGSKELKRLFAFELQSSRVIENRSNSFPTLDPCSEIDCPKQAAGCMDHINTKSRAHFFNPLISIS